MAQQRFAPRQAADWFGFYRYDSAEDERWRGCRVIDLSALGAGLELLGTSPDESLTGPLTISLELRGMTRSVVTESEGHSARVGIEFPMPSEGARDYLRSLSGSLSRW